MIWLLLACKARGPDKPDLWPFPSAHLVLDDHLELPELPHAPDGTLFDVDRLRFRSGFSAVQTTVIDPGTAIDPTTLPTRADSDTAGSVQIWDLDAGERVRCFAELDAYPDLHGEDPVILVRPMEPMIPGHRVAVVTTPELKTAAGDPFSVDWFDAVVGGRPAESLEDWTDHYRDLVDDLTALGVDVGFAIDFPIGEAAILRSIDVPTPTVWTFDRVDDKGLPKGTWRRIEGSFTTTSFLDGGSFVLDSDGVPTAQGSTEADLYIHLPDSVRTAAPGSVPVWIFGHGIFQTPEAYLSDLDDENGLVDLANRAGAILVATKWRGLDYDDLPTAVAVGDDFGRLPELTDTLSQGVLDTLQLAALTRAGGLLQDPALEGLPDPSQLFYFGVSLGAIEGAVVQALDPSFEAAVLHVGGSTWSTMLERSSDWPVFEDLVVADLPSAKERQLAYAATQLYWDPVDPASYVAQLQGRSILWQESIGDEQVANLTTETLMRGVGAVLLAPEVSAPPGFVADAAPIAPAWSQFDPELGIPPDVNRPAEVSGAHTTPRTWDGMKNQVIRFLDPEDPGVVESFCGATACTAENTGAE